jgi:dephospho-CoA kinase
MSHAVMAWGRFNPPTEEGHGKLVKAVQDHAEKVGGSHYVFPTHTQDKKKNPLTHSDKVGTMRKLFPGANVVSHDKVRTIMDAMKHLESKGHKEVTVVAGSDRVDQYHKMLNQYRSKEYPKIKKVNVVSAGQRDPDAEGAEGMSASKLRGLVASGNKKEFMKHYSDKKLGAELHDKVKAGMQMESVTPVGIFLLGGPGSGKDYVLKNIFSRFDLTEVQADQLLTGRANELIENKQNIVINGVADINKIEEARAILEGYEFDYVYVTVTNKVSRMRNEEREIPLPENKRLEKWYRGEKLKEQLDCFVFNNSINLNESGEIEKVLFAGQIEKLLERLVEQGLSITETPEPKTFTTIKEKYFPPVAKHKSGLPKKYVGKLSDTTAAARKAHWKKMSKLSDKDPRAYEPAPGDKTSKTKPSKHTLAVRKMMGEAPEDLPPKIRRVSRSGNITAVHQKRDLNDAERAAFERAKISIATSKVQEEVIDEGAADSSLAAKAKKSGISIGKLRKVYNRGVAAWNSGHRPGTTPQQWGHARVNSYINKGKTYYTADKDLREDTDINQLFEYQLVGTDEYRKHAIAMTPGQGEIEDAFPVKSPNKKPVAVPAKKGESIVSQYTEHTNCGTPNCCGECDGASGESNESNIPRSFRAVR